MGVYRGGYPHGPVDTRRVAELVNVPHAVSDQNWLAIAVLQTTVFDTQAEHNVRLVQLATIVPATIGLATYHTGMVFCESLHGSSSYRNRRPLDDLFYQFSGLIERHFRCVIPMLGQKVSLSKCAKPLVLTLLEFNDKLCRLPPV